MPLVQEEFLASLSVVPGVVRTPDGRINIKGSGESQSMMLADSTEMVDPITGSYSIELPLDAIESGGGFRRRPTTRSTGIFPGVLPPSDQASLQ